MSSGARLTMFQSWQPSLTKHWPWASYITTSCPHFLIYKLITYNYLRVTGEISKFSIWWIKDCCKFFDILPTERWKSQSSYSWFWADLLRLWWMEWNSSVLGLNFQRTSSIHHLWMTGEAPQGSSQTVREEEEHRQTQLSSHSTKAPSVWVKPPWTLKTSLTTSWISPKEPSWHNLKQKNHPAEACPIFWP